MRTQRSQLCGIGALTVAHSDLIACATGGKNDPLAVRRELGITFLACRGDETRRRAGLALRAGYPNAMNVCIEDQPGIGEAASLASKRRPSCGLPEPEAAILHRLTLVLN
jgi:hypothetical protein